METLSWKWLLTILLSSVCSSERIIMKGSMTYNATIEEVNFVYFFGYNRLLSHVNCNTATACQIQMEYQAMAGGITTAQYTITFYRVTPSTLGILLACKTVIGFRKFFPSRHLFQSSCDSASSTPVFPPATSSIADNFDVSIYTRGFIDEKQLRLLINTDHTHMLIPSSDRLYEIQFYIGVIYNGRSYCRLQTTDGEPAFLNFNDNINEGYSNMKVINSFALIWPSFHRKVYELTCHYYRVVDGKKTKFYKTKTLTITKIEIPSLTLLDHFHIDEDFIARAYMVVGSNTPVNMSSITFTRLNGNIPDEVSLVHDYSFNRFHYFNLTFLINLNTFGVYNLTVKLSTGETFMETFNAANSYNTTLKSISVVPLQKIAANGTDVVLECRVELQGPGMINWTRKEEEIRNVPSISIEFDPSSTDTFKITRLIFSPIDYEDTGTYTCSARASYRIYESSEILVLPPDSPYFNPEYEDDPTGNGGNDRSTKPIDSDVYAIVGGVVGGLIFLIGIGVLAGVGLYCFWKNYYIYVYDGRKILICARNKNFKKVSMEEDAPEDEEYCMDRGEEESLKSEEIQEDPKEGDSIKDKLVAAIGAAMTYNGKEKRKEKAKRNSSTKESTKDEEHDKNIDNTSETLGHQETTDKKKKKKEQGKDGIHSKLGGMHSELEQALKARTVDEKSKPSTNETRIDDDDDKSLERKDGGKEKDDLERAKEREKDDHERAKEKESREDKSQERRDKEDRSQERRDKEDRYRERRDKEDRSQERRNKEDRYRERRDKEDRSQERRNKEDRYRERRDKEDRSQERRNREDRSRERRDRKDRYRERSREDRSGEGRREDRYRKRRSREDRSRDRRREDRSRERRDREDRHRR